jgi:hypothetical protein
MTALSRTALGAIGSRPEELKTFLKTLSIEDRAHIRQSAPRATLGAVDGRGGATMATALQPTRKEIVVFGSVTIVTAALTLWAITAVVS